MFQGGNLFLINQFDLRSSLGTIEKARVLLLATFYITGNIYHPNHFKSSSILCHLLS